jgi:hypothetical protein
MMPETRGKPTNISWQQAKLKRRATEFQQGEEGKALNQLKSSCQGKAYGAYKFKV